MSIWVQGLTREVVLSSILGERGCAKGVAVPVKGGQWGSVFLRVPRCCDHTSTFIPGELGSPVFALYLLSLVEDCSGILSPQNVHCLYMWTMLVPTTQVESVGVWVGTMSGVLYQSHRCSLNLAEGCGWESRNTCCGLLSGVSPGWQLAAYVSVFSFSCKSMAAPLKHFSVFTDL